jgi:hypothetical protein
VRICPVCSREFKPSKLRQITCSVECSRQRKTAASPNPPSNADETHTISDNEWRISLPKTRIASLPALIEHFQVDLKEWKVKHFTANKWEMGSKNELGGVDVTPLFQVKAVFIPNEEGRQASAILKDFKELALSWAPKPKPVKRPPVKDGHLLELSIYDLHLGKLAWHAETGWSDYDSRITLDLLEDGVETLLSRTSQFPIEKILFPIGHDFFQVDSPNNTTFRGTAVDVDSRFKRTYKLGLDRLCQTIERLRQIAPVDVVMVPGNHDFFSNFTLGVALECFFHNYTDVTIDNTPTVRKYYQYGRTLLGLTHGNDIKHGDLYSLMATEAPVQFADTTWREWHLGHLHKEHLTEKHGIRTRILPSLCAADAWHGSKGFVGNLRLAEAFVWHKEQCLVTQAFYYVPDLRPGQPELFMKKK